jgi:tellurite resistance protein TerC
MGTWTLWIAFNAGVALLLLLDLGLFHRRAHAVSIREAAVESAVWVALSVAFGLWILSSHGRGPGLEFFTGYVIEKSLSVDNVFVFILIFQYFRVDPRYQHRLLFWGVLGAVVMRGAMIGAGAILIQRFEWILYALGAFLVYGGFKLFGVDHMVHPEKNPLLRWAEKILPMSRTGSGPRLFVREGGRWLATPLLLVVIVLETTDLALGADSVAAVFGVTRDPFLVYTSNVCAILGLRAFYFLLVGILPYFQYLDEGLAIVLMFIGAKMLAEPWIHISTGISLAVVGSVITAAILISIFRTQITPSTGAVVPTGRPAPGRAFARLEVRRCPAPTPEYIYGLAHRDFDQRAQVAWDLSRHGAARTLNWFAEWLKDEGFRGLVVQEQFTPPGGQKVSFRKLTIGIAVLPETFDRIRTANGSPPLADVPPDLDALEFELEFTGQFIPTPRLDILTTKAPGGDGAIARFLSKFGEGIQQVEIDVNDVDHATEILRTRFQIEPIYPVTRPGANGTRVNFFLVTSWNGSKVLVELVEQPKIVSRSDFTSHEKS